MYYQVFLVGLLGGISPGPDFFVVLKNSLGHGKRMGIATALGIGLALTIHISCTILGLALFLQKNPTIFRIIQVIGAIYLFRLGWQSLLTKSSSQQLIDSQSENNIQGTEQKSLAAGFKEGFFCNMLNPKAALFFLSVFSQFLTVNTAFWVQWLYGLEIMIAVVGWFLLLASLVSTSFFRRTANAYLHWFNRVLGLALLYYALRIIWGSVSTIA
ncbi:MAG TPA: LysE family transporter [Bacillota bacterium]